MYSIARITLQPICFITLKIAFLSSHFHISEYHNLLGTLIMPRKSHIRPSLQYSNYNPIEKLLDVNYTLYSKNYTYIIHHRYLISWI